MNYNLGSRTKFILTAVLVLSGAGILTARDLSENNTNFSGNHLSFAASVYVLGAYSFNPQVLNVLMMQSTLDEFKIQEDDTIPETYEPMFLRKPKINRLPYFDHEIDKGYYNQFPGLRMNYDVDSVDFDVTATEMIDSVPVSVSYTVPIDEYLRLRRRQITQEKWDSLMSSYDLEKALSKGDLSRMLSQATGLTIPIPPNPISNLFGKPEISLSVNGEVNVTLGWRWDSQNLGTVSQFGQTQSSPIFNQNIRLNVQGKIGDKLKLGTDWNTQRTFDLDNKFKIGYEGEDDDIVKLVEVGNVNLPLTTSLIRGGETLFGIRSDFQFGPLYLKTLVSQKRGQPKVVDVKGGASKQYFQLHAYDYAKNHFFLDTAYIRVFDAYFKNTTPVILPEFDSLRIKEIEVYESTNSVQGGITQGGTSIAIADLPATQRWAGYPASIRNTDQKAGYAVGGNFVRMDTNQYKIDLNLGTLTIKNMRQDRYYAVAYRTEGPTADTSDDRYYGTFSYLSGQSKDTALILKLIYYPNLQPGFKSLWARQMKNVFDVNARNVNVNETNIGVWYIRQTNDSTDVLEGAPDKLVTILGVDRVNNSTGATPPDGLFDLKPPFFDPVEGTITFPSTRPFDSALVRYFSQPNVGNPDLAYQYMFSSPYDTTYDAARLNTARDRFVISVEVSGRATNRISLGAFNLARNSVRVFLDGVELVENQDYVVDYFAGTLTLRNPRATLPNANLKVEYEQRDVFNISTRTLMGVRGDFILHKSRSSLANLGFTLMHYDQSALIDRVRLGDEPISNTMFGFDGTFHYDAQWITEALDALPFYDTKAPSSLNMKGEWALMLPTPNKRNSEIASDNNEPVVYIDDFEGAQRNIPLGLSPGQWQHSSAPEDSTLWESDSAASMFRAKTFWYQHFIPYIDVTEIYPKNTSYQQGRQKVSPLELVFDPSIRGIYNRNPQYLDTADGQFYNPSAPYANDPLVRRKVWGGLQRLLSSFNTNFDTENIEYIEIMMRINRWEPGQTKMFVDLGQISEDVIPNKLLNTEDGITKNSPYPNGIIDPGEDVGIDQIDDKAEQDAYPYPLNQEKDPARDNYVFDFRQDDQTRKPIDFANYNNFEGNSLVSELGQFPDTEILNSNNGQTLSLDNSYFSYEVQLDPDPVNNPQIVGGNPDKGWFLYRIPVRKPNKQVGNPLFSNIQYVRVRVQGGAFEAQIADWHLVGSQWQRVSNLQTTPSNDSTLSTSFVNLWENDGAPDFYTMPPGVSAPKVLGNPDPNQDIRLNEQSISVSVKDLRYGDERMATRIFRQMDLFYYKRLKLFVHGDGTMPDVVVKGAVPKAFTYIRFGIDSSNYYEYRQPLLRGWQEIDIDLTQLTAIKQTRDTSHLYDRQVFAVPGKEDAVFVIRGNPTLTKVQFFGLGIANPAERFPNELTTTMWVDELRLINPEASADWAGVGSVSLKLADLASVDASFQNSQPNFHQLEERFGLRSNSTNWTVNIQANLDKFAPKSFNQMKIPVTYTHAEAMETPQYVANNDINLEQAANNAYNSTIIQTGNAELANAARNDVIARSQTLRVTDNWAVTGFKFGIPSNFFLIDNTFNKVTLGYSYSQEYERNPLYEERFNWVWRLNMQYALPIPDIAIVKPLEWAENVPILDTYSKLKLNFLPNSFNYGFVMTRRRQTEQSRFLDFPSPVIRDFSAQRNVNFTWKFAEGGFLNPVIDYNVSTFSTMVGKEFDEYGRQRTGGEIASAILFNNGNVIDFGRNTQHTQTVAINFRPRLPNIGNITNFFDITGSFNTTYNWNDPLSADPALADVVKNVSYTNNIRINTAIRWRALSEEWFGKQGATKRGGPGPGGLPDTSAAATISGGIFDVFRTIFFDWEKVDLTFNQINASVNPGVFGGTGMDNFWARGLTFRGSEMSSGPSMAYQLGLINYPHGGFNLVGSSSFPFFGFDTYPGLRPPNARLQDNFRQQTTMEIRTSRPLWPGATMDLNWKTELGFNKNQIVQTDEFGNQTFTNVIITESFNRTFISFPSIFGFNPFHNTIDHVVELYEQKKAPIAARYDRGEIDQASRNQLYQQALSDAFYQGLEAFSISSGNASKFLPSFNWVIRWEGLEKFWLWKDYIKRMTFDHSYISTYQENTQITDNGKNVLSQTVQYGFQPLVGLNATFDDKKFDGTLTATLRWSSTKSYSVNNASRSIVTAQSTDEITAQASYVMRGFDFPLFGINLKNDFELSFLFTYKHNGRDTYDVTEPSGTYTGDQSQGRVLDGNTQIIVEPRARYSLSNRVTASAFVRYDGTFTEGAAQPGFHTIQVGFDFRLSLAGGR